MIENVNMGHIGGMDATARTEKTSPKPSSQEGKSTPSELGSDKVQFSDEGEFASKLMSDVAKMPETRPEVVNEFQGKVRGGNWPPPALVDGLVRLVGNNLLLDEAEAEA